MSKAGIKIYISSYTYLGDGQEKIYKFLNILVLAKSRQRILKSYIFEVNKVYTFIMLDMDMPRCGMNCARHGFQCQFLGKEKCST